MVASQVWVQVQDCTTVIARAQCCLENKAVFTSRGSSRHHLLVLYSWKVLTGRLRWKLTCLKMTASSSGKWPQCTGLQLSSERKDPSRLCGPGEHLGKVLLVRSGCSHTCQVPVEMQMSEHMCNLSLRQGSCSVGTCGTCVAGEHSARGPAPPARRCV